MFLPTLFSGVPDVQPSRDTARTLQEFSDSRQDPRWLSLQPLFASHREIELNLVLESALPPRMNLCGDALLTKSCEMIRDERLTMMRNKSSQTACTRLQLRNVKEVTN